MAVPFTHSLKNQSIGTPTCFSTMPRKSSVVALRPEKLSWKSCIIALKRSSFPVLRSSMSMRSMCMIRAPFSEIIVQRRAEGVREPLETVRDVGRDGLLHVTLRQHHVTRVHHGVTQSPVCFLGHHDVQWRCAFVLGVVGRE